MCDICVSWHTAVRCHFPLRHHACEHGKWSSIGARDLPRPQSSGAWETASISDSSVVDRPCAEQRVVMNLVSVSGPVLFFVVDYPDAASCCRYRGLSPETTFAVNRVVYTFIVQCYCLRTNSTVFI